MRSAVTQVIAPGKMMLTGSYAVLHGAPALVCAVDRRAVARAPSGGPTSPEVATACGEGEAPPSVDVSELARGGQKLGLGSSAAAVVAALGYRAAARGEQLGAATVRDAIFRDARAAHARVQGGGSGVDIAASVHGGVVRYALDAEGCASIAPASLPLAVRVDAYWSGKSARTSELRARVDALRARSPRVFDATMRDLCLAAALADSAAREGDATSFVSAVSAGARALAALGRDADASIVPPEASLVALAAGAEGAAFAPSGAGGGDVFVRVGIAPPGPQFDAAALAAGFERLDLHVDALGVRVHPGLGEPQS